MLSWHEVLVQVVDGEAKRCRFPVAVGSSVDLQEGRVYVWEESRGEATAKVFNRSFCEEASGRGKIFLGGAF